ncbi:hypothetical protein WKN98_001638 [Escherichia coli]
MSEGNMEFKGTPGEWIADIRGGCAAIYPKDRANDTPGCHYSDERNIAYSTKGANYDVAAGYWNLDPSVEHDFRLMAAAPKLLVALQDMVALVKSRAYPQPDKPLSDWGRADAAELIIKEALGEE